ncbi:MAG TPA: OsmC family protein [Myxococcaceae bacterium]|nr:OsmC family protein [Myxococcaceae bacterium]
MTAVTTGVQMQVVSEPKLKCRLTHGPSGTVIHSEAPKDNGGTGGSFSPTDLVGAALASCAVTTMAIAAGRENVPWGETSAQVEKRMTPPPRRIGELVLEITMPRELPKDQRARFEQIARECPVSRSLHPDLKVPMTFRYPEG